MKLIIRVLRALHFVAKFGWWMGAMGFVFLVLPQIMSWTNSLILSVPIQYVELDLSPLPWEIKTTLSNHDIFGSMPLWFFASGVGFVSYGLWKLIWRLR